MANFRDILDLSRKGTSLKASREEIEDYLVDELKTLSNWDKIDETLNQTGALSLIVGMLSAGYEINYHYNSVSYRNSSLKNADMEEAIIAKAMDLGYRINRPNAPILLVEYDKTPTITLQPGDVVGTYGDYDAVFFSEEEKVVEKGDKISVCVGKFREETLVFDRTDNSIYFDILPEQLSAIDNTRTTLLLNNEVQEKTLFPEDYIVYSKYADYSLDKNSMKLLVANLELVYGIAESLNSTTSNTVILRCLETDGKLSSFDLNEFESEDWIIRGIQSYGTNADSNEDIQRDAPLLYSIMRRAVSTPDHVFLLRNQQYLNDVSIKPWDSQVGVYTFEINTLEVGQYFIGVNNSNYSYQRVDETLDNDAVIQILYSQIVGSDVVAPVIRGEEGSKYLELTSLDPKLILSFSSSSNITQTMVAEQQAPRTSVFHVRYVRDNVVADPIPLTNAEYKVIASVVDPMFPTGNTYLYEAADRKDVSLNYTLFLNDNVENDDVRSIVDKVMQRFDKQIDLVVDSNYILETLRSEVIFELGNAAISRTLDNNPVVEYVDKDHYSHLDVSLTLR